MMTCRCFLPTPAIATMRVTASELRPATVDLREPMHKGGGVPDLPFDVDSHSTRVKRIRVRTPDWLRPNNVHISGPVGLRIEIEPSGISLRGLSLAARSFYVSNSPKQNGPIW
jgi:hypothetical protein